MTDNKQNLEKLRKLVDRVQTFDNNGTVLMMQDSRNKKVLYNSYIYKIYSICLANNKRKINKN